jgi:hypothetical protein
MRVEYRRKNKPGVQYRSPLTSLHVSPMGRGSQSPLPLRERARVGVNHILISAPTMIIRLSAMVTPRLANTTTIQPAK